MLAEAVEAERFACGINFAVGTDFGVAIFRGPNSDIGVEAFTVPDYRCEQEEVAAGFHLGTEPRAELIAGLSLNRDVTIRTVLKAEAGEKETDEMVDFSNGGNCTFTTAAGIALFDTDGGRKAGDKVHIRTGHLFDELASVG